jgi:hypothetical protein
MKMIWMAQLWKKKLWKDKKKSKSPKQNEIQKKEYIYAFTITPYFKKHVFTPLALCLRWLMWLNYF